MKFRAFTLVEVLVSSLLLLMILVAVYGSFTLSRDYFASVRACSQTNQEAMKGVLGLERLLSHAEPTTIEVSLQPQGVRFLSALSKEGENFAHAPDGKLLWQSWVAVYRNQENQLVVKSQPIIASAALPAQGSWPSLSTLAGDQSLSARVLARDIVDLAFPAAPPDLFRVAVTARLEENRFPSGRPSKQLTKPIYETTFQGEITLRNKETL